MVKRSSFVVNEPKVKTGFASIRCQFLFWANYDLGIPERITQIRDASKVFTFLILVARARHPSGAYRIPLETDLLMPS